MSESTEPLHAGTSQTGELLAAYLAGDVDDLTAARLERALQQDSQLRRQLDQIYGVVSSMEQLDAVDVPSGFEDRLQRRITGAHTEARSTPARATTAWWQRPSSAVAALVVLAVVALSSVSGLGGGADDESASDSAEFSEQQAEEEAAGDGGGVAAAAATDAAPDMADGNDAAALAAPAASEIIEFGSPDDIAALVERVQSDPSESLLEGVEGETDQREQPPLGGAAADLLTAEGLALSCVEELTTDEPLAVIATTINGARAVGTVTRTTQDAVIGRLVDPGTCDEVFRTPG